MNARVRRILTATLIVLLVVLLAGATYQGVATAFERHEYPRPGGLIDVGGHQLHIYCTGEGSPVVVLEGPAMGVSVGWGWVQPEVAKTTRTCSYDRAGLAWSEAGDRPFDPRRVPEELHTLLIGANVPAPYVLVGHSLGAAFARLFASRYPAAIAGLVLVDPAVAGEGDNPHLMALSPWLARAGVLRAMRILSNNARGLPDRSAGAVGAFLNRPDHLTRASRELAKWDEAVTLARDVRIPEVPVATVHVLEARDVDDGSLLSRSPFLNDRDAAGDVTAAILDVVAKARAPL